MTQCTADFELGTNGNSILTSDAGSATAWNGITGGGGAPIYTNAHPAFGNLGGKFFNGAGGGSSYAEWNTALGTVTDHYGRLYIYMTALLSGNMPLIEFQQSGSRALRIDIMPSGVIRAYDSPAANVTTTNAIAVSQQVRLEWHIVHSTTVGLVDLKLFNTASSTTPTETLTSPTNRNTLTSANGVIFGPNNGPGVNCTVFLDNIIAGSASYPGPFVAATAYQPGFRFGFRG